MFMTNSISMLQWWTWDSAPLPSAMWHQSNRTDKRIGLVVKLCNGDPSGERKCNVTSIKPNWQANWTYIAIT